MIAQLAQDPHIGNVRKQKLRVKLAVVMHTSTQELEAGGLSQPEDHSFLLVIKDDPDED